MGVNRQQIMKYNYRTRAEIVLCSECEELLTLCECLECQDCQELTPANIAGKCCECGGQYFLE